MTLTPTEAFFAKEIILGIAISAIWFRAPLLAWVKWAICGVLAFMFLVILLAFLHLRF